MSPSVAAAPVHLVKGSDDSLRNDAVLKLVGELVGAEDRSLVLDEFGGADLSLAAVVSAAQTPPFLTARRVVVVRHAGQFGTGEAVAPLVAYLADPVVTTSLVLVWEKLPDTGSRLAALPKKLNEAISTAGGLVHDSEPGKTAKARSPWIDEQIRAAGVHLDRQAVGLVAEQLGEDLGRLPGLLTILEAVFGAGAELGVAEVEPYLGQAGAVPPWDLTDAIDRGDTSRALALLERMLGAGGRHPLQVMATLQTHFGRMLRLDGAGVGNEKQAAELLGMKGSTFPARKALDRTSALGHRGVTRAIELLAEADVTLRGGGRSWPPELVIEVLVARLAALGGRGGARGRATRGRA